MPAVTAATETVPQPFGRGRHTLEPGGLHHRMHRPPSAHPRPRPEPHAATFAAPSVQLPDAVYHVDCIEQGRGYGHAAKNPPAALFEAFEYQHAGGEID